VASVAAVVIGDAAALVVAIVVVAAAALVVAGDADALVVAKAVVVFAQSYCWAATNPGDDETPMDCVAIYSVGPNQSPCRAIRYCDNRYICNCHHTRCCSKSIDNKV
jgi:hypothetical protein